MMRTQVRRMSAAAVVGAGVLLLAGCGSDTAVDAAADGGGAAQVVVSDSARACSALKRLTVHEGVDERPAVPKRREALVC